MRAVIVIVIGVLLLVGGGGYLLSINDDGNAQIAIVPTATVVPTINSTSPTNEPTPTPTPEPTPTIEPVSVGSTYVSTEALASILSNTTYATLRLENYGNADFLVAQSNGTELFYLQSNGNMYSKGDASFNAISIRGMGVLGEMLVKGEATFNNGFAVTQGNISVNGDLSFVGPQTISGSGSVTINPTGNINFNLLTTT